jgi:hypothetical protein
VRAPGADANSGNRFGDGSWLESRLEVIPMHVTANLFLALEHTSASKNRSGRTEPTKPSHVNQSKIRKTYKNSCVVILFIAAMRQWLEIKYLQQPEHDFTHLWAYEHAKNNKLKARVCDQQHLQHL